MHVRVVCQSGGATVIPGFSASICPESNCTWGEICCQLKRQIDIFTVVSLPLFLHVDNDVPEGFFPRSIGFGFPTLSDQNYCVV